MSELKKILKNKSFSLDNIEYLLTENEKAKRKKIKEYSKSIQRLLGNNSHNSEHILEISNHCDANCTFCLARNENTSLNRYRLNREEIIDKVIGFYKRGVKSILLHSGYDDFYNSERISYIVYSIKKMTNIHVTLSLGLRNFDEYKEWKISGADSYFLNFVTSNSTLYNSTKSFGTFEDRLIHIAELKKIGFSVGTGSIIGLPNQTINDLASDIYLCRQLNTDYIDFCHYNNNKENNLDFSIKEFIRRSINVAQLVNPSKYVRLNNLIN